MCHFTTRDADDLEFNINPELKITQQIKLK